MSPFPSPRPACQTQEIVRIRPLGGPGCVVQHQPHESNDPTAGGESQRTPSTARRLGTTSRTFRTEPRTCYGQRRLQLPEGTLRVGFPKDATTATVSQ
jgi:hypothetical protein